MMDEGMQIKGSLTLVLAKLNGEVKVVHKDNIIVNGGFDFVADAIGNSGSRPGVMGWIAVGTGTHRRSLDPDGTGHRESSATPPLMPTRLAPRCSLSRPVMRQAMPQVH
jgi:hypothetical protein